MKRKLTVLTFLLAILLVAAPSLYSQDVVYNSFKQKIMDGSIDLDTHTIKVALVTSTYTADQDSHEDYADITNELPAAGNYTVGGATLANKAVTKDNTNNRGKFDADDVTWAAATFTARGAIIYYDSGTDATSWFIAYIDFGTDKTATAGDFVIRWNANGILIIAD